MTNEPEHSNPATTNANQASVNEPQLQFQTNEATDDVDPTTVIESLQAQLADAEKRVLLAHADLENFRRRNRRDMQDQLKFASIGLIGEILDAVDNLHRAIEAHEKDPTTGGLAEGVKLVAQQISNTLQNHGCQKIEAVGQPFDPTKHQAVQMQPNEEVPPNTVLMDLRPGFQLHERVIRPSQVFVSTGQQK